MGEETGSRGKVRSESVVAVAVYCGGFADARRTENDHFQIDPVGSVAMDGRDNERKFGEVKEVLWNSYQWEIMIG
jgi:hypothetical protein